MAVEVMQELGIDISDNQTKDVFEMYKKGEVYSFVITVCDGANAERCPVFPGIVSRLQWSFNDPAVLQGSQEEKLEAAREIRDQIRTAVSRFIMEYSKKTA